MLEYIKDVITNNLINSNLISQEDEEIYKFGLECYLLKLVHVITYSLAAIFLGKYIEYTIFIITYLLLRKFSGGIHANTRLGCLIVSNVILIFSLFVGDYINDLMLISFFSFMGFIVTIIYSPVDNPNRKLSLIEKKRFKKYTILLCVILEILLILLESNEYRKWIYLAIIINAESVFLGKIKYTITTK